MARLGILLYRLLATLLAWPFAAVFRKHPNFRGPMLPRLGTRPPEVPFRRRPLWVHAASVGEVKAVAGLVRAVREHAPGLSICMSCMTATGRAVAARTPGVDMVFAVPFDTPGAMRKHLLRLMPVALIVVETEIWPSMILESRRLSIPVAIVNARMSERAHERYLRFAAVFRQVLAGVKVLAMAGADADRFRSIGALDVEVIGNLKLDHVAAADPAQAAALRAGLDIGDRPVFIAGSVREGEEKAVVEAIIRIAGQIDGLYSIIAPRHPDRVAYIADMAKGLNIACGLRSQGSTGGDLLIVDTMGELFTLYGISDAAFVGGSLLDMGGQNILEPIAWGVPTLHGPFMGNFTWALEAVQGHTTVVRDARELARAVITMLRDRDASRARGNAARDALLACSGVTGRYLRAIEPYLQSR
jgi:3-deoxy-D-manno-octulosonic-acid transferase